MSCYYKYLGGDLCHDGQHCVMIATLPTAKIE